MKNYYSRIRGTVTEMYAYTAYKLSFAVLLIFSSVHTNTLSHKFYLC